MVGLRATAGRVVAGLRSLLAALLLAWLLPISPAGAAVSPGAVAPDAGAAADPVNTYTGEYFSEDADLVLPNTVPPLRFIRTYNSLDTRVTPLGPGWIFNFHSHISNPGLGTLDLVVVGPQGRSDFYTHTPDGAYLPPPGVHAALQKNVDNTYTLTMPDGSSEFFDGFGNLRQLTDPQGHRTDLGYDLQLRLVTVRDAGSGAGLDFAYDPTGERLLSVSTAAAPIQVVHYAYDSAGRLSTVTAADGRITRYTYAGSSIRVNAVLDGQGTPLLQIAYDDQGRVTSELEGNGIGNGQPITFTYVKQPGGGLVTTITYPPIPSEAGWRPVTQDTYDALGRLVQRLDRPTANETVTERRVYNASSDIVSQTVEDTTLTTPATAPCRFVLGFRTLHYLVPTQVGQCLDNEQHAGNGDAVQHTTTGLLVWRAADNWTAFTDGYHTWVNGPNGVQERLNTQRFAWEANPAGLPTVR